MHKLATLALAALLLATAAGCSSNPQAPSGTNPNGAPQQSEDNANGSIRIEDIDWRVESGIEHGNRRVSFDFTNNSGYDILGIDLDLELKEDLTSEDLQTAFADLLANDVTEEQLRDWTIGGTICVKVEPGASSLSDFITAGMWYLTDMAQYECTEPSIMTIRYLADNKMYTEYYDFKTGTYDLSNDVIEADQWTDGPLSSILPQPEGEVVTDVDESDTRLSFDTTGTSADGFAAYIDACRDNGFTSNVTSTDTTYYADSEDGLYHIDLFYSDYSGSITAYCDVADPEA